MKFKLAVTFLILGFATGCGHTHGVEGPQEKAEIPEGIRVSMGGSELKEGEKINVLRPDCRMEYRGRQGNVKKCVSSKIGEARVVKILDHDSAIVKPDEGVTMDKDTRVEKKK